MQLSAEECSLNANHLHAVVRRPEPLTKSKAEKIHLLFSFNKSLICEERGTLCLEQQMYQHAGSVKRGFHFRWIYRVSTAADEPERQVNTFVDTRTLSLK